MGKNIQEMSVYVKRNYLSCEIQAKSVRSEL